MKLSDYAKLSEKEKTLVRAELVKRANLPRSPENHPHLWEILKNYEKKYGMTTEEMLAKPFEDEHDFICWRMYADLTNDRM